MENITQACIYVGTYAKYTNSSLFGEWLTLSDYSSKEEFYNACKEVHKDEQDPEFMFQDWESIPSDYIGESWISEEIFRIIEAVRDLSDSEQQAFYIWLNYSGILSDDTDSLICDFKCEYQGYYDNKEDFAYEIIDSCYDLPEFAKSYFDYEKFAYDLFKGDYWQADGYVFQN